MLCIVSGFSFIYKMFKDPFDLCMLTFPGTVIVDVAYLLCCCVMSCLKSCCDIFNFVSFSNMQSYLCFANSLNFDTQCLKDIFKYVSVFSANHQFSVFNGR